MKLKEVRSLSSSFPTGTFHERNYILRQEQLTSYDGNTKYSVKCLLLKSTAKQVKIQFLTFSSHTENYMWRDTCSVTLVLTLETVTSYTYDILGDIHSLKLQHFTEGHVVSSYHCESQHSQSWYQTPTCTLLITALIQWKTWFYESVSKLYLALAIDWLEMLTLK